MRNRVLSRTGLLAIIVTGAAALLLSATAFAGTPSLGAGCGSGATIAGSDTAGKVTLGLNNTVCVLTFSTAFTNAPACMAMNETNGGAHATGAGVKSTTATLTIDAAAPWADGDTIAYTCSSY
jgi:hypothetical protein